MLNRAVVDARPQSDQSKTSADRQRFVRRARAQIKDAVKKAISTGDIKSLEQGKIRVPVKDMNEPTFQRDPKTGSRDLVHTGNKDWIPGDTIEKPSSGTGEGSGKGGSPDGEGQDDFAFVLTPDEFYDVLFEDMELPDLMKKTMKQITKVTRKRAGFVISGNPSQLDIRQTYKFAFARHKALGRPTVQDIEEAEANLKTAEQCGQQFDIEMYADILNELRVAQQRVPLIDNIDLRYRNYPPRPEPITKAVMFAMMDVSGSMDEDRKDLAKRFFLLLYVWLMKQYNRQVEIVFIRHHTVAEEVDEHTFFHSQESGGTVVSTVFPVMEKAIQERYNPNEWNIYACYASDGDNWMDDNQRVIESLKKLMPRLQYFAYLQVADTNNDTSSLWAAYKQVGKEFSHIKSTVAVDPEEIWPVFRELFTKDISK
jgi:uncharacterized sporulation protein YeaH/YhbH (DUF444 family)